MLKLKHNCFTVQLHEAPHNRNDAKFKFAKIQNAHVEEGVGGARGILMLSSNLLKSKIPTLRGGPWNFDTEFKFAKIQNSHVVGVGGGARGILMLSSNLLKSKMPVLRVGGGGGLVEF